MHDVQGSPSIDVVLYQLRDEPLPKKLDVFGERGESGSDPSASA